MFTVDYIRTCITSRDYDTIAIFDGNDKNQIDYHKGTPNELEDALDRFYEGCEFGTYTIHLYRDGEQDGAGARRDSTRRRKLKFRKVHETNSTVQNRDESGSFYMQEILRLREENMQIKFDRKLDEYKAESSNQGVEMIRQIFTMMSATKGGSGGIAQAPKKDVRTNENEPDKDELIQALDAWQNADPEFLENMKALAKLATDNPEMYQQAKKILAQHGDG